MDPATPLAELDAMRKVVDALSSLEPASVSRVLRWAHEQYGVATNNARPVARPAHTSDVQASLDVNVIASHSAELADFYASCAPKTDAQKTLVVSFWLQERAGVKGIDSQRVNSELKHLGHGVGNITRAFDVLIKSKPQLVIQTKKAGTTKQARKLYKVTVEGRNLVEAAVGRGSIDGVSDQQL